MAPASDEAKLVAPTDRPAAGWGSLVPVPARRPTSRQGDHLGLDVGATDGLARAEGVRAADALRSGLDLPSSPRSAYRRPRRAQVALTRLWALVKMALLAWSVQWAMSYLHAGAGEALCGYGAACLFAGFGARWRRRFFGPGQVLEPEFYDEVATWLYRAGTVAVLAGGALYAVSALRGGTG